MLTQAEHDDAVGAKAIPCSAVLGVAMMTCDDDVPPATYRHTVLGVSPDVVTYIVKSPSSPSARAVMPRQPSEPADVVLPRRNEEPCVHAWYDVQENFTIPFDASQTYTSVGNAVAVDVVIAKPPTCDVISDPLAMHENAREEPDVDVGSDPQEPTNPRQYCTLPLPVLIVWAVAYNVEKATRLAYTENVSCGV